MTTELLLHVPARTIPVPEFLSPQAKMMLASEAGPAVNWPPSQDKEAWRTLIRSMDEATLALLQPMVANLSANIEQRNIDGVAVYEIEPPEVDPADRAVVLDFHGGGLILGGGPLCRMMGIVAANRCKRRVWSVDYRMPPDYPYPAALDDGIKVYRALLQERSPGDIVISGGSAGGNLAAALILCIREAGLPMPAGVILNTPEIDLTESGDSFHTNLGVDTGLASLMPVNVLYADGHDLRDPCLSPLFADFSKGFPPTLLTTGTRDLYLSNTVRMHRALRAADIRAELHILEAASHVGFPGSPESALIEQEVRCFIASVLSSTDSDSRGR